MIINFEKKIFSPYLKDSTKKNVLNSFRYGVKVLSFFDNNERSLLYLLVNRPIRFLTLFDLREGSREARGEGDRRSMVIRSVPMV